MPNPDSGNLKSDLGGKAKSAMPKTGGSMGSVNEKTASWPGLPGKAGPNRSNGVEKCRIHPKSEGL